MLAWMLLSCTPEPRWLVTREACGLDESQVVASPLAEPDRLLVSYDEDCARAIGGDLGVKWRRFPNAELPGALDGDPLEGLIAGAFTLMTADLGTVDEVLDDPDAPPAWASWERSFAARMDIGEDEPASRLLYETLAYAVRDTVPTDVRPDWYLPITRTLHVTRNDPDVSDVLDVVAHESSHLFVHAHDCASADLAWPSADADWDGATAAGAFVTLRYLERTPDEAFERPTPTRSQMADAARYRTEGRLCEGFALPETVAARFDAVEADRW